jgi:hypothetical protein
VVASISGRVLAGLAEAPQAYKEDVDAVVDIVTGAQMAKSTFVDSCCGIKVDQVESMKRMLGEKNFVRSS